MLDEPTETEIRVVAVEGGADTLPVGYGVTVAPLRDNDPLQTTGPIAYRVAAGTPTPWQQLRRRMNISHVAEWIRPTAAPLVGWTGMVAPHTVRRWLGKARVRAFLVGVIAGAAGLWVGSVLVASLVAAALADTLDVAAALIGGAS